jgi:plasmid rolling circle replication initiator protein Rep
MSKTELVDVSATGRRRPWKRLKRSNTTTVNALNKIGYGKKARNIADCGNVLEYGSCPEGHGMWLNKAYFCKERVCSLCNWRKSLFVYYQFLIVAHKLLELYPNIAFCFNTLTTRNCALEDLSDTIKHYFESYRRFLRRGKIKRAFKGTFRSLETTYNPLSNTFHPHLHTIVVVSRSYFSGGAYIKQAELTQLWKESLQLDPKDDDPICHIAKIKPKKKNISTVDEEILLMDKELIEQALVAGGAEVAKYSVKVSDIMAPAVKPDDTKAMVRAKVELRNDPDRQAIILGHLVKGIARHRLIAYTGLFRKAYQALKCSDVEKSDLVMVDGSKEKPPCTCKVCQSELTQLHYIWNGEGYFQAEMKKASKFSPQYYRKERFSKAVAEHDKREKAISI